MKLFIPKDIFDNPRPPRVFLATTGKKIMGQLPAYETSLDAKWNTYAEFSFSIDRKYTDVLTGQTVVNPLFDKAEGLRKVYVENIGYFVIQDPDSTYGEKDTKTLSCFSSEYETSSKYLENFRINTGEIDSKEVIANESENGYNYTIDKDKFYKTATKFDAYEKYYIQDYTDSDSYTYERVEISNLNEYNKYDGSTVAKTLYIERYPNVRFYWPDRPELSLLHLIFAKIPEWKIGNVDRNLFSQERTFSEDRIAVYDFLMNDVSDTFKCVVEWDTINNIVNFYEEAEDGINDDNTIQTRWDTDIFISRNNLANEININYSTDDIKTKLKVSGADNLDIREVNIGKNYLINLDYYHTPDWMEPDLFEAYDDYLEAVELYTPQYKDIVKHRVSAYNKWNDLMNAVPTEGNVVLVGDKFEKLYCVYTPINTAYFKTTITNSHIDTIVDVLYSDADCTKPINTDSLSNGKTFVVQGYSFVYVLSDKKFKCVENLIDRNLNGKDGKNGLLTKLTQYHINEDDNESNTDNILLRLTNDDSDVATIRIRNSGTKLEPNYVIQRTIVRYASGLTDAVAEYTMRQWIKGELTATTMGLDNFTVRYIGIMGAYFVLAKDELIVDDNGLLKISQDYLNDCGINLLREKHKIYTTIFQTQTEAMFSQEKYQCTASDEPPIGDISENTRWLDTNSNPVKLYQYKDKGWVEISASVSADDQKNYENYQRYIDNYEKLKAIQKVLLEKEIKAQYLSYGYSVSDKKINAKLYKPGIDGVLRYKNQSLEADMQRVAEQHFKDHTVTRVGMDTSIPLYTFKTSKYPNSTMRVYLNGTTPYVANKQSVGVYEAWMQSLSEAVDFENFFTEDQWIRISPFVREDEFNDSNFLLTGYESEEERVEICNELIKSANKELKTLCQPSLEFSMDMANILAIPEFKSLTSQFQLGNFVRVYIRDGYVKRARLLEVSLNFDDLSDFNCSFGNLVTTKSEIDKHADLLAQAVSAGKQVATAAGDWQKAVDKSNKLEQAIANGLQDSSLQVGRASGQAISWDGTGMHFRKYKDGSTTEFEPEEMAIINNALVATNDSWRTSKAAFGKYTVNGETRWGPIAEYVTADTIEGKFLKGGSIQIGDETKEGGSLFIVHEDGSVQIMSNGVEKYASVDALTQINNSRQYHVELSYNKSTIFGKPGQDCTLTCKVYKWDDEITLPSGTVYNWLRNGVLYKTTSTPTLTITNTDIETNAIFSCQITFDETNIT